MEKQYSRYDFVVSMKSLTRETYIQTPKRNCQQESFQSNGLVWKFHTTGISWSLSRLLSKNNKCLLYQRPRRSDTVCLTVLSRWSKRKPVDKRTPRVQRKLDKKKTVYLIWIKTVVVKKYHVAQCLKDALKSFMISKGRWCEYFQKHPKTSNMMDQKIERITELFSQCVVLLQQNGCQSMSHVGYLLIPFCLWNTTCSPIIMEVEITQACKGNVLVLEGSHFLMIMDEKVLTGIFGCFCFHYNPSESMRILPRNSSWGQDFVVSSPIQWRSDESQPGEGWQILGLMRWIQGKGPRSMMHRCFFGR